MKPEECSNYQKHEREKEVVPLPYNIAAKLGLYEQKAHFQKAVHFFKSINPQLFQRRNLQLSVTVPT